LLQADGSRTEDQKETLETLMMTHFTERLILSKTDTVHNEEPEIMDNSSAAWKISKGMFDCKKEKWTINSLIPHKLPGPDQIFPALLQRGLKTLASNLSAYV
jgi:hypothetical protein